MQSILFSACFAAILGAGPAIAANTGELTPKRGGTLTYMIPADAPPSLDGHREATYAMVHTVAPFYSVLMRVNPENPADTTQFVCDLCTSIPRPTDNAKTYTFKIRTDAKFHDGTSLTAADVAASWHEIIFPRPGGTERTAKLVFGSGFGGVARSDHCRIPLEVCNNHLPAITRRPLCVHLPQGDPG